MTNARIDAWLFDLGNTRLKFAALRDGGRLGETGAITHGNRFDQAMLGQLPHGATAYVASVAGGELEAALLSALRTRFDHCMQVRTQAECDGVQIAYADPARLGVDRFLALLAAHARGPGDVLVIGVGTALTIDLLDTRGRHHGGRIAPSPALMREMLQQRAPALKVEGGQYVEFAGDTPDALASGCEGAALALIERSREQARALLGGEPGVLLHGGGGQALRGRLGDAQWTPQLVLEGLARWARLQD